MNETDTLGLELLRAHRGNQLAAPARGENKCDAAAAARVAARRCDEIHQDGFTLASRDAAAVLGIFAAGGGCAIWRICDDQIEARGLDARDLLVAEIGVDCVHRFELVDCGASRDHRGECRLDLNRDDFARAVKRGHYDRYDAASCSQLEHSIARICVGEASEQDCFDREPIAVRWLDQRDRTVEDRIATFVA